MCANRGQSISGIRHSGDRLPSTSKSCVLGYDKKLGESEDKDERCILFEVSVFLMVEAGRTVNG